MTTIGMMMKILGRLHQLPISCANSSNADVPQKIARDFCMGLSHARHTMKQSPANLNAAIKILDTISPRYLRGSDQASLSKFTQLCRHWQMATLDEVNRRAAVARREK